MNKGAGRKRGNDLGIILFAAVFLFAVLSIAISSSILVTSMEIGVKVSSYEEAFYIIVVVSDIFIITFSAIKLVTTYRSFLELVSEMNIKKAGLPAATTEKKTALPLNRNEEMIVSIITGNGGKMLQNAIVLNSGLSASTVTRVLTSLEEKGVIEKSRYGMTNEISLKTV